MQILILFATFEGQTGKIARFVDGAVRDAGHEPKLVDVGDEKVEVPLKGIDRVILAAPVHERRHPRAFEVVLAGHRAELMTRETLLLSVSLSAAFPEGQEEARDYLEELKLRTGFTPTAEALVAGAVRSQRYDYFASQVVRHVVLRGRDYDASAGEHEFTDWGALKGVVAEFLRAPALA